jgi:hypothetical protein
VADVAGLVLNCVGDLRYGRLDFSRHRVIDGHTQVPRNETDTEYFDRAFDDLVALRSELAVIETNYDSLLHTHAPLVQQAGSVQSLKTTVNATVLHTLGLAANRTTGIGWVIVHMQGLETALERFQSAHELTRELITVYLSEFPELRDLVIDDLISNTEGVLDQYGQFFSEQKRADLAVLLAQADQERQDEDLPAVIAELNEIASELQSELNNVWDANSSLRAIASKLKFVFGSCDTSGASHPLVSAQYFGDLAVAARIVQEGDDAPYCNR